MSRNQGAYNMSRLTGKQITNNVGSQSSSGSVNEQGLPNGQDVHNEGVKATLDNNQGNSAGKGINNTGWGQS
jgi:hypothetical protein